MAGFDNNTVGNMSRVRLEKMSGQLSFEGLQSVAAGNSESCFSASATPQAERDALEIKYRSLIEVAGWANRTLVSFQANKNLPFYRWFKYREGFAAPMVRKVLTMLHKPGELLDPFAGAGSALFAGRELGWRTTGIELLPPGQIAIETRVAAEKVCATEFEQFASEAQKKDWLSEATRKISPFKHLRITQGAFPLENELALTAYLAWVDSINANSEIKQLLRFAAFSVLEDISFTRKDGQYLRWDSRSGRSLGARQFNKGPVLTLKQALNKQLRMMADDLLELGGLFRAEPSKRSALPALTLLKGSCFEHLPKIRPNTFDCVFTSPPYCNRYDYTRTYALELAFSGFDEDAVKSLRQAMLFCTVENREKVDVLSAQYKGESRRGVFAAANEAFRNQAALQEVLAIIDNLRDRGALNNPGIAKLVRNYFYEMSIVIFECARILRTGGIFVMVNDNVRYAGERIPVDLILTEFAAAAGLAPQRIWTLGRGKGNSSQQMGVHGRTELRKSICVWRKP